MGQSATEDRERFSWLFEAHYALVRAFAERRVGRDLSDEVTAETFLVAWRRLEAVPAEPLPWLYGVARNVVLRQLSASARQATARELLARERPSPVAEDDGEHDGLWRAWEQLSDTDREVLSLMAWEELSVRDAATVLGVPASVFSVRLHRARRRLERHLEQPASSSIPAISEARGPRARLAVCGAGISAVVAAIIAAAISGSAAAPAFAGWSARPMPALPGQITDATRRCGLAAPVLVEARGPYTAEVFASRSGGSACVEGPSVSFVGSIGGVRAPDNPITPNQIQTAVASGSDAGGHAFLLLAGRVGSAVRSIVIHRSNHIDVVASIKHGWYLAWWPARAHATDATVTTTSGAHDIALPSLATSSPASCGPPLSGCAALQAGSNGSAGVPGPPLVGGPLGKPFGGTLLLQVENAVNVLVCYHPPRNAAAAMQPNGPTGPCTHAARLTRLPSRYPVQKNLLEVFPNSVWKVKLPTGTADHGKLVFLVVAIGTHSYGQIRNEITVKW